MHADKGHIGVTLLDYLEMPIHKRSTHFLRRTFSCWIVSCVPTRERWRAVKEHVHSRSTMASAAAQTPATSTAPRSSDSPFKVTVLFSSAGVRVVVRQPGPAEASARRAYNSGQRQCCNHLLSQPPKGFDVEVSGGFSAPVVEVKIQPCLLQQLPVLADIAGSTEDAGAESLAKQEETEPAEINLELPCSIWGLVSVLIIIEGVSLRRWFRSNAPDCDPSLPVQTLEVRYF